MNDTEERKEKIWHIEAYGDNTKTLGRHFYAIGETANDVMDKVKGTDKFDTIVKIESLALMDGQLPTKPSWHWTVTGKALPGFAGPVWWSNEKEFKDDKPANFVAPSLSTLELLIEKRGINPVVVTKVNRVDFI